MIQAVIIKDSLGEYKEIRIDGHAGYAESGQDIICAAVSVLAQNAVNSIETFTDDPFQAEVNEEDGALAVRFQDSVSEKTKLLLDSMVLGLESIEESYGSQYIRIRFEEV
ncbi:MAG: ribosomal-processing cysteine protease Prp [Lachnospiraceae bacterium]|nr:ribosomal-processing cysteine protease Prp [Candidatus Fimimorpha excrementavium]